MKLKIEDLEKAINWMKKNSPDVMCIINEVDGGAKITCKDRYGQYVDMKLASEGTRTPKIIKEDDLA